MKHIDRICYRVRAVRLILSLALLFFPTAVVLAQSGDGYNLEWNTFDGGGGMFSSGGAYSLGGTIGQPDAGAPTGGSYALSGGFWNSPAAPQAAIRYAAPSTVGSGDCSSWTNACTLQTALTQAISGDEIWVKAGVHYPGAAGNRDATFQLKNGVAVYGGFAGTETARDQRNWQTNVTILSGDIDQNDNHGGDYINESYTQIVGSNAYHVVSGSGTNNTALLDGFLITAGYANGSTDADKSGGGMLNNSGGPTLNNLIFSGSRAAWYGGGMHNVNSNPALTNVAFNGNRGYTGGGMSNWNSSNPALSNVTFNGNSAEDSGGGMVNYWNSAPSLTNALFHSNTARYNGGGMFNYTSSPALTNVVFSGNSSSNRGGGMLNSSSSSPTLKNAILWGNSASSGANLYNDLSFPNISYSDIGGCGGSSSWNSACGTNGGGNIDANPLFVDPANNNLHLQLASPAIDAGNNAVVTVSTDLDGNPRFVDIPTIPDTGNGAPPIVDMGAYETQYVDVALVKTVTPEVVAPSEMITFTLTLSNSSNSSIAADGIVVTDTLSALLDDVTFASNLVVTDTGHVPSYVWLVHELAPGQVGNITVSGKLTTPLAAGTYTNTAFISATADLIAENNTAFINFTVPNVAPTFDTTPVNTATQNTPYIYTAIAKDDNGDVLTITAPTLPFWLTLTDHGNGTATLFGTPSSADVGDHIVVLYVTDASGLSETQSFTITVVRAPNISIFLPLVFGNGQ